MAILQRKSRGIVIGSVLEFKVVSLWDCSGQVKGHAYRELAREPLERLWR